MLCTWPSSGQEWAASRWILQRLQARRPQLTTGAARRMPVPVSRAQLVIRLRRRRPDASKIGSSIRRGLAWPLQRAGQLAHVVLSKAMLLSCEVALEYMLGLTYSPQARMACLLLSHALRCVHPALSPRPWQRAHRRPKWQGLPGWSLHLLHQVRGLPLQASPGSVIAEGGFVSRHMHIGG